MFLNQLTFKTYQEFEKKEQEFWKVLGSGELEENAYNELVLFFKNLPTEGRGKYQHTYWRWFVFITWDRLNAISKDDLLEFVDKQLLMAAMLGYQTWRELLNYLVINCYDEESSKALYSKLRNKILTSDVPIGSDKGKLLTIAGAVERIRKMNRQNTTSIEQAEIISSLKLAIFPKNEAPSYMVPTADEVVRELVALVNFLEAIDMDGIWEMMEYYIENDYYSKFNEYGAEETSPKFPDDLQNAINDLFKRVAEKQNRPMVKPASQVDYQQDFRSNAAIMQNTGKKPEPAKTVELVKKEESKVIAEPKKQEVKPETKKPVESKVSVKKEDPMFFKKDPVKPADSSLESIPAPQAFQKPPEPKKEEEKKPEVKQKPKLSYGDIRKQIETRFPKDPNGEFVNVMDVLAELAKMAGENGDDKIKDLYYFNEQTSQFEWHDTTGVH
jgi:hypothetical protein